MKTKKIRIADLTTGMKIKSYQEGAIVYRKVIDKWDTQVTEDQQVRLEFTNNTVINCSVNHPIMVMDNNVVTQKYPRDLTEYDNIISENGTVYLYSITIGQKNPIGYIDITVEDTNTFFASSSVTAPMVLTHNSQGGVRNGCVGADSLVKICKGIEVDGVEYSPSDTIIVNNCEVIVHKLANALANMTDEEIENASLQDVYERSKSMGIG
jgi:hypothetical protein